MMKLPLFTHYLFADYSGAGANSDRQRRIEVYECRGGGEPQRQRAEDRNFSRDLLRQEVEARLDSANRNGDRYFFGFDHQFSWPHWLWRLVGLDHLGWREALRELVTGGGLRPALDIPSRFCAAFNSFAGCGAFSAPIAARAHQYHIGQEAFPATQPRFRLTERCRPFQDLPAGRDFNPKPADCVGGNGQGSVGGQTLCGLLQLGELARRSDVAFWPFDGLDIAGAAYGGKHVAAEIYPSILHPGPRDDHDDARESCRFVSQKDQDDGLPALLDLSRLTPAHQTLVSLEGWTPGMDPGTAP